MIPKHWAEFVGFLVARDVTLYLQVLERHEEEFKARYEKVTGEQPQTLDGVGYQVVPDDAKYGNSSSVVFTACDSELFIVHCYSIASEFRGRVKKLTQEHTNQWAVYSNRLTWRLLESGFVLGIKQDLGRVRREISEDALESFDKGVERGRE